MAQENSINTRNNNISFPVRDLINKIIQESNDNINNNSGIENTVAPKPDAAVPAYSVNNHSAEQPVVNYQNKTTTEQPINNYKYKTVSQEQVEQFKSGDKTIADLLKMLQPAPIDEKRLDRNRMWGSIGESVKALAQILGAHFGAHVQLNKPGSSLTDYFLNEEKQLRDMYDKKMNAYKSLVLQTALNEYNRKLEDEKTQKLWDRQDKIHAEDLTWRENQSKQQAKDRADLETLKQMYLNDPNSFNNKYKTQQLEEQKRRNSASISQGWVTANAAKQNAETNKEKAIKSIESPGKIVPLVFKDGTTINIPENTWKANAPVLVDILSDSGVETPVTWTITSPNFQQMENFVKRNKDKLPKEAINFLKGMESGESVPYNTQQQQPQQPTVQWGTQSGWQPNQTSGKINIEGY